MGVVLTTEAAFYAAGAVQKRVKADLLLGFPPISVVQGLRGGVSIGVRLYPLADAQHAHRKGGSQNEQRDRASVMRHDQPHPLTEHRDDHAAVYGVGGAAQQVGIRHLRVAARFVAIARQVQRVRANERTFRTTQHRNQ